MLKALFALPSTMWLLGLVSFFNDSASELVYPLVPLYLASVLMAVPKALGSPILALAGSWPVVLGLRFADRVGKGLRTSPRDAMLALSIAPHQRGLAFGFHRALDMPVRWSARCSPSGRSTAACRSATSCCGHWCRA